MAERGGQTRRRPWLWGAVLLVLLVSWACGRSGDTSTDGTGGATGATGATRKPDASAHPSRTPTTSTPKPSPGSPTTPSGKYDPAAYAPQVRARAAEAGVSPRLLMAILYNESYKPHDPALERAWQRYKPGAAFGIANMHRAAFDETKRGRAFAGRRWEELPDDRDLAVRAAAWYLHDLARQLPAHPSGPYDKDELLALGYNAGAGNMQAFARGATPGSQAADYLSRLRSNWEKAGRAVARTGRG
ncbi:transglycosylase SLT domain-containing protein [Streptomyces sp. NPDC058293]|uniref:Lytic transglycosylase domain-containing protein n=1 Tax=Streptomyces sp. NBC_00119 TaxID=2975659 RepID=A0AAU1U6S4_9ACTN|nr:MULTISPECIES: transglycosylase SLT domain-containing protein [unclassified Streptomyces]MCX4642591.1 lytic transglycosylase domain-containing protein [Streptomyces sp. NBC_01446]MCX5327532.1 lytic transglycosylase domain-containing protein [Streptomyces sp. NBC_00120]